MNTEDYEKLDFAILMTIEKGSTRFKEIWPKVDHIAKDYHPLPWPEYHAHYVTQKRLNFLSRNGQAKYNRISGWRVL